MSRRKIFLGLGCLLVACAIYLVLRKDTIHLYRWWQAVAGSGSLGQLREMARSWQVPAFVRYSLPDGLYCMAYILIADGIMSGEEGLVRHVVVSVIPVAAIVHECLQYAGLARGTFDPADLLCYSLPLAGYFLYGSMRPASGSV